jgi:mRNA degradation ribonuclease J1/J2
MVDSTNAEVPGFTTAEIEIGPVIDRVFHRSQGRIIVACFASHVHRVQQVLDTAVAHKRKVAYVGRSMIRNMKRGTDLGYLNVPADTLVDSKEIGDYPPERTVLISTGSQGEPLSALSRIAQRTHNFVHIEEGDTVVLASSLIPGNENAVYRRDQRPRPLGRPGRAQGQRARARVRARVAGELLYCYNIVRPKNVLPVHGEIRHMQANAALAAATGVPAEHVVIAEDGVVVDLMDGKIEIAGKVPCGFVYVDGESVGDITEASLKDRRILGEEGFVSVVVVIDTQTTKVSSGPEIHARGFLEDDAVFDEIKQPIVDASTRRCARAPTTPTSCSRPYVASSALGQQHPPPPPHDHPGGRRGLTAESGEKQRDSRLALLFSRLGGWGVGVTGRGGGPRPRSCGGGGPRRASSRPARGAADEHARGELLPAQQHREDGAKTGSVVMMIAVRVGGRCACAQVWPSSASAAGTTAM